MKGRIVMEAYKMNYTVTLPSYSVGTDCYKEIPWVTRHFGKKAVVVGGKTAMEKAKPELLKALEGTDVEILDFIWYGGNSTYENTEALKNNPTVQAADMVFGVGGGRAVDTCKVFCDQLDKPLFTFPTIASNCAASSSLAIVYNEDGSFCAVNHQGQMLSGRAYYDYADRLARRAWHEHDQVSLDWMWYLWCGRFSPLSGRVVKTFERTYFADRSTWEEPRDPYFSHTEDPAMCARVLEEFGADVERGVIINGHTPVHAAAGESPVKAGGRLVVIDGGFCQAYHSTTGIAGYTLIADPEGMRIKAHRPFGSIADVLDLNADIVSDDDRFQRNPRPLFIGDTDTGADIRGQIADLRALLDAYRTGEVLERTGA